MPAHLSLLRSISANSRLVGLAFIFAIGLTALVGVSIVAAQRGTPVEPAEAESYRACVNSHSGSLRIIAEGRECKGNEALIVLGGAAGDAALLERIEALEADNASQQALIETQQGEIMTLHGELDDLSAAHAALQAQVPACLSTSGAEVYFIGCNVNIRNGHESEETDSTNGLGNLIIGYNEVNPGAVRTGSHNLVVGPFHDYTSYGGLVAGNTNTISGPYASVTGGAGNTASGQFSSISGGSSNRTSETYSSVSGGAGNTASGSWSSVSGGESNTASGENSSVSGGRGNEASGDSSSISGGLTNTTSIGGSFSSISGGEDNLTSGYASSVGGGNDNTASGPYSSVGGGTDLVADGTSEFLP